MAFSLAGKVCLITGASSGIGAATAVCFAKQGAKLALTGRNANGLAKTVDACKAESKIKEIDIFTIVADLAEIADRERVVSDTVKHFGKLDVLVNNAGIGAIGTIECPEIMEQFDVIYNVNVKAPLHLMNLAVPHLIATKGSVVNVSSLSGQRASTRAVAYNMSKAAIDQMTASTALELAPHGVRVNSVNPGVIITQIHRRCGIDDEALLTNYFNHHLETHPLSVSTGKLPEAKDVADAIAFLASNASRYTTGSCFPVDGGRHATCLR